jgi:UDP-N-acetylmuramoyl-tripeptide--D-alanyl-D-alanine ligase
MGDHLHGRTVTGGYATLALVTDPGPMPTPAAAGRPVPSTPPVLTGQELAAVTGGHLLAGSDRPIRGAAVDSRAVVAGCLFAALPGERTDGHRFLGAAVSAGATALLVARPPDVSAGEPALEALGDVTIVQVPDVQRALHAVAAAWRDRFHPLVVGITGSVAKTSTKEAVAAVLGARFRTLRTEGNQNNEVGLPLTVLRLGPEHEAAVLEMGMYTGGEIADLARIARPSIGIVTAVQPVHLSRIGSIDAVEAAKGELVEALPPAGEGGVAILNADDHRVRRMTARTQARAVTYGFAPDADVRAEDVQSAGLDGMRFTLLAAGIRLSVAIPTLGPMAVHNALAGAAAGLAAGLAPEEIRAGLAGGWAAPHRAQVVRAGGVVLIDDSYNASPGSVRAALELLAGIPGRRIAVLGEMLELGELHETGHRDVGASAAGVCDLLVVVGGQAGAGAAGITEGALAAGLPRDRVAAVADRAEAAEVLGRRLEPGDVVLVKASRGIELDLLVDAVVDQQAGATLKGPPG